MQNSVALAHTSGVQLFRDEQFHRWTMIKAPCWSQAVRTGWSISKPNVVQEDQNLAFVFYGRPWFLLLSFYLFSSPNLSRPRLDVYHTSTHDVALVWIWDAGLKCAARGSLEMQDAKNLHFGTIAQLCRALSSQLRHVLTIGKKLLKQQYLLQISSQYGELQPTNGWDRFTSLGHPSKF